MIFVQNPLRIRFRVFSVIYLRQFIRPGGTEDFFCFLTVFPYDVEDQDTNLNAKASQKDKFILLHERIRLLCNGHRCNIADHPVIHAKPGISDILVRFFVGVCSDLNQSIVAG